MPTYEYRCEDCGEAFEQPGNLPSRSFTRVCGGRGTLRTIAHERASIVALTSSISIRSFRRSRMASAL